MANFDWKKKIIDNLRDTLKREPTQNEIDLERQIVLRNSKVIVIRKDGSRFIEDVDKESYDPLQSIWYEE